MKAIIINAIITTLWLMVFMTPYKVFVMHLTLEQYLAWVVSQLILIPPIIASLSWTRKKVGKLKSPDS